jgi:hypothetical protein
MLLYSIYVAASLFVLQSIAMIDMVPFSVLPWFFLYMVADVLVVSSLAIAVGSACASPSDAQHLAMVAIFRGRSSRLRCIPTAFSPGK